MLTTILLLCFFAFLAGFIDSIVGGGGLIQTPALLLILPESTPIATVFGTGKVAGMLGTSVAMVQYTRKVKVPWKTVLPASLVAFCFSFLGARAVSHLPAELARPLVLGLLVAVLIYTSLRKDMGSIHAPRLTEKVQFWFSLLVGVVLGFYDGFFGPGMGSFLMFIFIALFGFDFLTASASAKVVNIATNLSAVLYFAITDNILYQYSLPMAASNMAGSAIGARLAISKGSGFVRVMFLFIVSAIILKLGWDTFSTK